MWSGITHNDSGQPTILAQDPKIFHTVFSRTQASCLHAQFSSVQSLSHVRLFANPWMAACSRIHELSITNSRSLFKLMSIELVMLSNHLILCHPLLLQPSIFPSSFLGRTFLRSLFFVSGGQSMGASASASVLPMNVQG